MDLVVKFLFLLLGKLKVMLFSVLNRIECDLRVLVMWKDFKMVFIDRLIWWEVREEVGLGVSC